MSFLLRFRPAPSPYPACPSPPSMHGDLRSPTSSQFPFSSSFLFDLWTGAAQSIYNAPGGPGPVNILNHASCADDHPCFYSFRATDSIRSFTVHRPSSNSSCDERPLSPGRQRYPRHTYATPTALTPSSLNLRPHILKSTSPQPQTTDRRLHNRTPRPHRCRRRRRRLRREQEQNIFFILVVLVADKLGPERSEPVHEERCVEAESLWDCVYARGEPVAGLWE